MICPRRDLSEQVEQGLRGRYPRSTDVWYFAQDLAKFMIHQKISKFASSDFMVRFKGWACFYSCVS